MKLSEAIYEGIKIAPNKLCNEYIAHTADGRWATDALGAAWISISRKNGLVVIHEDGTEDYYIPGLLDFTVNWPELLKSWKGIGLPELEERIPGTTVLAWVETANDDSGKSRRWISKELEKVGL